MLKLSSYILSCLLTATSCNKDNNLTEVLPSENQIIANHAIVADFDKIPSNYMDSVKKMMVGFHGESHSEAYRTGLNLLEEAYPEYACNISTGEAYSDKYLRVNSGPVTGESDWFTWLACSVPPSPAKDAIKNLIKEYYDHGHPLNVLGFAWCWDMVENFGSNETDPEYGCHWYGWSIGGPDGDLCWGLDSTDYSLTANRVSMNTYLTATEEYNSFCKTNGYNTKVIYTTGPVDGECTGERGYQNYLKHQFIRDYVATDSTKILFDYADILCYDEDGTQTTISWGGHVFPHITSTNIGDASIGHIGSAGAIRLAKAQWWLLARIAGWDGN